MRILGTIASSVKISTTSFESIATTTASGGTGTVTFSSIPGTYKHLQIRAIATGVDDAGSSGNISMRVNSDTTSNYNRHALYGDGTTVTATGSAASSITISNWGNTMLLSYPTVLIIDVIDYADTTKLKTIRSFSGIDSNGTQIAEINISSGLWRSTSAITSISFLSAGYYAGTTFALYGIKG
jgi:hypothetical protein